MYISLILINLQLLNLYLNNLTQVSSCIMIFFWIFRKNRTFLHANIMYPAKKGRKSLQLLPCLTSGKNTRGHKLYKSLFVFLLERYVFCRNNRD